MALVKDLFFFFAYTITYYLPGVLAVAFSAIAAGKRTRIMHRPRSVCALAHCQNCGTFESEEVV